MIDLLIPIAFEFRKAELWLLLADNNIYGVQLRDGRTGYCSVMGNGGNHYALGLYIGNEGWNTYLDICSMAECRTDADMAQIAYRLDCINCDYMDQRDIKPSPVKDAVLSFAEKHGFRKTGTAALPDFTRHSPCQMPWTITRQSDADAMEDALMASVFLAKYLEHNSMGSAGFLHEGIRPTDIGGQSIPFLVPKGKTWEIRSAILPGRKPIVYPTPKFDHPEIIMQMAMLKPSSNLECRQLVLGTPVMETNIPCLPVLIMAVDGNTGHVTVTKATADSPDVAQEQIFDLSLKILNLGYRPTRIYVQDDRTQALLKDFCTKTGIPMQRVSRLKHLHEAWESLSNAISRNKNIQS